MLLYAGILDILSHSKYFISGIMSSAYSLENIDQFGKVFSFCFIPDIGLVENSHYCSLEKCAF